LQGTKILLLGVPLDGAEIAKWGRSLNCQAAAAHIGSQELTKLHSDLVTALVHPARGAGSAETLVDIWSLVAADDDIVAASESLLREMPIKTQKIVSVKSESGDVPATHFNLIQVLTPDHPAHLVLHKMMVTPWAPSTRRDKIGIWIARISPEQEGEHQRTLKRLFEKLLEGLPHLKDRVELTLVNENVGTCDKPEVESRRVGRLARLVNARIVIWGKALSYGPTLEVCMVSFPYGSVVVRRLEWLPLATPYPDPLLTSPTLGPPLAIATMAVARLLADEGQYPEAEALLDSLDTSSASAYGHYVLYYAAAVQVIRASKTEDQTALKLATEYLQRARTAAVLRGDKAAASAFSLYGVMWPVFFARETRTAPLYVGKNREIIENVVLDARTRDDKLLLGRALFYAGIVLYFDFYSTNSHDAVEEGLRALEEVIQLIPVAGLLPEEVILARLVYAADLYARGFQRDLGSIARALDEFRQLAVVIGPSNRSGRTMAILSAMMCMMNLNQYLEVVTFARPLLKDLDDKEAEGVAHLMLSEALRRNTSQGKERQRETFVESFQELEMAREAAKGVRPLEAIVEDTRGKWYSVLPSKSNRELYLREAAGAYESVIQLATPAAEEEGYGWWRMMYGNRRTNTMEMIGDWAWLRLGQVNEEMAGLPSTNTVKIKRLEAAHSAYVRARQVGSAPQRIAADEGVKRVERVMGDLTRR